MRQIKNAPITSNLFAFCTLDTVLHKMLNSRLAATSSMSGVPTGNHVVGRLQAIFDISSFPNLLNSLLLIRDVSRAAAEVLRTLPGLRTDHYTVDKTQIATYVDAIINSMQFTNVGADHRDIIVDLIVEYAADPSAWTLVQRSGDKDLHIMFTSLYTNVITGYEGGTMPVYRTSDEVALIESLPQFQKANEQGSQQNGDLPDLSQTLKDATTITKLAAVKIIDHVYSLLMSVELWSHFISPRSDGRSAAANIERAKTLDVLAVVCQSLLSYSHRFALEMYLQGYHASSAWIGELIPFSKTVQDMLDRYRDMDVFDAHSDARSIFEPFSVSGREASSPIHLIFPTELVGPTGLRQAQKDMAAKTTALKYHTTFSNLSVLMEPQFLPLLSGTPAGRLSLIQSLGYASLVSNTAKSNIENAFKNALLSGGMQSTHEVIGRAKALNLRAHLPFNGSVAIGNDVVNTFDSHLSDGVLKMDSALPSHSRAYVDFIKSRTRGTIFTGSFISENFTEFLNPQIPNYDKAAALQADWIVNYSSMQPSQYGISNYRYTTKDLLKGGEFLRQLVGQLVHMPIEQLALYLADDLVMTKIATAFSGFALVYLDRPAIIARIGQIEDVAPKTNPVGLELVIGKGMPYGTSYEQLAALQGDMKTGVVFVLPGFYLRILNKLPRITRTLVLKKQTDLDAPYYYYASNGGVMSATEWVICEGLWNFALLPVSALPATPTLTFSINRFFPYQELYINVSESFDPTLKSTGREDQVIPVSEHKWMHFQFQPWITYKTFGVYGTVTSVSPDEAGVDDTRKLLESHEKAIKEAKQEEEATASAARNSATKTEDAAAADGVKTRPVEGEGSDHTLVM